MRSFIKQPTDNGFVVPRNRRTSGFTLAEILISVAISGIMFSGILSGYVQAGKRAEWSGYNLAAGATAVQQIEQARAAIWETDGANNILNIALLARATNGTTITGHHTNVMDIPYKGGVNDYLVVTNYVTLKPVTVTNTTLSMMHVRVDAVWRFRAWGGNKFYTNTVATLIAPDDRTLGN